MTKTLDKNQKKKLRKIKVQLKKSAAKHAKQARQATDIAQASEKSSELHTQQVATLDKMIDEKRKKRKKRKLTKKPGSETSLRDWFKRKGAKGKKGGWVDCNAPDGKGGFKTCGRQKGEKRKHYPACRPTPAACRAKGKGKKWGKKAKRRSMKESYEMTKQIIHIELTNSK